MAIFALSQLQYEAIYNWLSFTLAAMLATTFFLWFRVSSIHENFKTPLIISGLVTLIAAYHNMRIINAWNRAYIYGDPGRNPDGTYETVGPYPSGVSFDEAYRYMDWILTVPLLLIEIVLVMKLDADTAFWKMVYLAVASVIMVGIGFPGEFILEEEKLIQRWSIWTLACIPFLYIVYELSFGLKGALEKETDPRVYANIWWAERITIVSWCTYPAVYLIPMFEEKGAHTVVASQIAHSIADVISKCGVALVIYRITLAKSQAHLRENYTENTPSLVHHSPRPLMQDTTYKMCCSSAQTPPLERAGVEV